jgi:hypothetical protein
MKNVPVQYQGSEQKSYTQMKTKIKLKRKHTKQLHLFEFLKAQI